MRKLPKIIKRKQKWPKMIKRKLKIGEKFNKNGQKTIKGKSAKITKIF